MSRSSEAVKRSRDKKRSLMIEAMGGKCVICGYSVQSGLTLHHINPELKTLSFGSVRSTNTSWPIVVEEMRKCTLLCANCHNEVHYQGLENYEFESSFNEDYSVTQITEQGHLINPLSQRNCVICNTILSTKQLNCCSEQCRIKWISTTKSKIDWEIELPSIIRMREEGFSFVDIATLYPVSDKTIAEHYYKYCKNNSG